MRVQPLEQRCPICDCLSEHVRPIPGWGEALKCTGCGFVFANPMQRSVSEKELFSQVYGGKVPRGILPHFAERLQHRKVLSKVRRLSHSTRLALNWLRHNLPPGSAVLDIGCGPGYLLDALRNHSYNAIGLEPGDLPVSILRQEGYQVWNGTAEDYPASWPEPQALTCFNMLHHLPDPVGFFRGVRKRFPGTPLLIAFPCWNAGGSQSANGRKIGISPPRTFSEWTRKALEIALAKAGYQAKVLHLRSSAGDLAAGAIEAFYLSSSNIPNYFLWLLMGQDLNDSPRERISQFRLNLRQRLQRLMGHPNLLWAVAQPTVAEPMKSTFSETGQLTR